MYDLVCLERDAEAESESLLSRGVLRGGESERSVAPAGEWYFENALVEDVGKVNNVNTSVMVLMYIRFEHEIGVCYKANLFIDQCNPQASAGERVRNDDVT